MTSNITHTGGPAKTNKTVNVAAHLTRMARRYPYQKAVIHPAGRDSHNRMAYSHLTFRQLDKLSDCLSQGLDSAGISRGTRTVLMVPPSPEFFILVFALFKVGAIPVVVDPGMGIPRMIRCLRDTKPTAFIGISKAHVLRFFYPRFFKTVKTWVTVGTRWFWGGLSLDQMYAAPGKPYPAAPTGIDETAAILFTTGSTGPPKGVVYTHGIFDAQIRHIRSHFKIEPGEIDLPTFPLFSLFDPALGMTAVIPDMDPTRPAHAHPVKIIEAIVDQGVTNMFASPALVRRVGEYGKTQGIRLPSLRRVISAGAPVSPDVIDTFSHMLSSRAEIHTPYGATEAMPVASIASKEILSKTRRMSEKGCGICVGRPIDGITIRIITITDAPIDRWNDDLVLPSGQIGEITVQGDLVTRRYYDHPAANDLAKIKDGNRFWHRMGDLGWIDTAGNLWFCGRKNHRVVISEETTLYSIPCEAIYNNHDRVYRSALVGVGDVPNQTPVICIELQKDADQQDQDEIRAALQALGNTSPHTKEIRNILFHDAFPVDIRHNAKIFREKLAEWAETQL
ncbi:MAG: peptide synthase [Deltaproteobacteria bacterium]|nr:MAG: peptide synthase [Deltaproteobacteria bacterium]